MKYTNNTEHNKTSVWLSKSLTKTKLLINLVKTMHNQHNTNLSGTTTQTCLQLEELTLATQSVDLLILTLCVQCPCSSFLWQRHFNLFILYLLTYFDLIFIGWWGILIDYLCGKFGNFSFSSFCFITQTNRITEAEQRYTHATTISLSNAENKQHWQKHANIVFHIRMKDNMSIQLPNDLVTNERQNSSIFIILKTPPSDCTSDYKST